MYIYRYIQDHKNRLKSVMDYFTDNEPYLMYNYKNNQLQKINYNYFHKILYRFFIYRYLVNKFEDKSEKDKFQLIYNLILNSYYELRKHYPDIKFILLEYNQEENKTEEELEMLRKLEQKGIICISTKELTKNNLNDPEYTMEDKYHPNAKAWQIITKPFLKRVEKITKESVL